MTEEQANLFTCKIKLFAVLLTLLIKQT